jgi:hypothetical protein
MYFWVRYVITDGSAFEVKGKKAKAIPVTGHEGS